MLQAGHLRGAEPRLSRSAAPAPQRGQCLLPTNITPKHEAQATVASRESQNLHSAASVAVAAPQFGQFKVSACIDSHFSRCIKLAWHKKVFGTRSALAND